MYCARFCCFDPDSFDRLALEPCQGFGAWALHG